IGDWLGTGRTRYSGEYRPFKEAREFVRSLGLNGQIEWQVYCKSGNKPDDIPSTPLLVYKKDWKDIGDWLGTEFLSFVDSREFARKLEFKNQKEWYGYSKSGNKPNNIPSRPEQVYKREWQGWGDFLGTGNVANQNKTYRSFKEAREFVRSLKFKNQKEWFEYCKLDDKPYDIPSNPNLNYKKDGWKSYGDWLGTGNSRNTKFRSYKEAREFVRSLNLKGAKEWNEYCVSGNKPDDIPAHPWEVYRKWKTK
ncbi:hypothetical protein OAJ02_06560, partial [Nitrosopumilus sp.]|nr:hypothetical protein [Nitrosopumilus sp.]